jgi:hypothetical protein
MPLRGPAPDLGPDRFPDLAVLPTGPKGVTAPSCRRANDLMIVFELKFRAPS